MRNVSTGLEITRQWQLFPTLTQIIYLCSCEPSQFITGVAIMKCCVVLVCENHLMFLIPHIVYSTCQACVSNHPDFVRCLCRLVIQSLLCTILIIIV
jgi:hypothetical protein